MKLTKLVLAGFKSFADRTEFEFDAGTSCIVGPNGCGKSNVVDAMKWVLGEQSVKSLRGGEMMDVIFNGSSARKPAGHAEVTMVFDNSDGLLRPTGDGEPPETISITRRLFRNGNSEYLINKLPSRLRDIREMFMDTGVGVDAYSVIEQGKVESFLQASQDDRRAIFDEAAGISKYKARKKEALRKLEKVDQNLLRINDVLAEVQKRLRSIKLQAGKARNYQSYTETLRGLRSLYVLAQYHQLSAVRTDLQRKLDAQSDALTALAGKIDQLENSRTATEAEAADLERSARDVDARLAGTTGAIAAATQRAEMLQSRVKELGEQLVRDAARCEGLEATLEETGKVLEIRRREQETMEEEIRVHASRYETLRAEHTQGELNIHSLTARLEDEKAGTMDLFRRTATLHNTIHGLGIRRENLSTERGRLVAKAGQIDSSLGGVLSERAELEVSLADIRALLSDAQAKLDENKSAGKKLHDSEQALMHQLSDAREQRSAVLGRRKALDEMQRRLEGVNAGVRRVLEARRQGRLESLAGMLGDFIQSDMSHAAVVESALAGADQQLVFHRYEHVQACADELVQIVGDSSNVEAICLDRLEPLCEEFGISAVPGVQGRVIDYARCDAWLAPALWRLLGRTLVVETLADASEASLRCGAGYRFVTRRGDVLEADGRVRIGAGNRGSGIISRRTELAELESRNRQLDEWIEQLQSRQATARNERQHLEDLQQKLRTAIYEANISHAECDSKLKQLNERVAQLEREKPLIAHEVDHLAAEIENAVAQEHDARAKAGEMERLSAERQKATADLETAIADSRKALAELSAQLTDVKVSLAQAEQRRLALRDALAGLTRQREQMAGDLQAGRNDIDLARQRRADAETGIARTGEELIRLRAQQETLLGEADEIAESRRGLTGRLEQIRALLGQHRASQEEAATAANQLRVELGEADVRIENLIGRSGDELHMDLLEAVKTYQHDDGRDWSAVEEEIKQLREKIERLGNVNMDAIAEQEELEQREKFLSEQLADITASKAQLEELIQKINRESHELFVRTFESVRGNFQELFRKLFGGGKADILLSNPDDVLESGIDIVARPPGKETRSLSLLSGGEKTMTALALLFSIFKSKPSPFCLLDEVDAALDEANNQRFNRLVDEFVATSQFIIISHSKRTMSMAGVLYGVTMQEPGVSKRIAVRFDESKKSAAEMETVAAE